MKRFCIYFFIWMLSSSFHSVYGQKEIPKPIIVLDPGHGGSDSGAIGVNGLQEKDVVLKIALEVLRLNKKLFSDTLDIYSTRYNDTLISLRHRTKLVTALKPKVFISIHCNQAGREAAQGIEVYIHKTNKRSEELARLFAAGLNQKLSFKNRGLKYGNFQVLRETTAYPSVLLELGFLSNYEEAEHNEKGSTISGYALLILETLLKLIGNG
ncbi:N-acetylmuramoyl-L-alanine amidase [uncultured Maribacter sp.]|uniref:N-acetylmuramoyl-L-alanine amidase family protein n=1 Tax=uncultured Maribacter sp. TaxID=431308 RepID=UPI00260E6264|nr:N-acetylmuramoyl-L-alanine amidase [uncultured Maribacter sp.]